MQCCQVAVFMYSPIDFNGFQHWLGEGGLATIRSDGTAKLTATGNERNVFLPSILPLLSTTQVSLSTLATFLTRVEIKKILVIFNDF